MSKARPNRFQKIAVVGVLAIVVMAMLGLSLRGPSIAVKQAEAELRTLRAYIAEDAETRLDDEYVIDVPFAGTVQRIEIEEGDRVAAGEMVAIMEMFDLEQQVMSMEALVIQARAQTIGVDEAKPKEEDLATAVLRVQEMKDNLAIAQRERSIAAIGAQNAAKEYERAEALVKNGVMSQSAYETRQLEARSAKEQLDRARLAEDAARKGLAIAEKNAARLEGSVDDNEYMRTFYEAEISNLEAQLRILRDDLDEASMESPVDGVVLEKFVEDRRFMQPGSPLLRIGDLDSIEIECDVLSEEIGQAKVGAKVEISGKALNGAVLLGAVSRIYPSGFKKISSLGIEQQRVKVIISFDNSEINLRPGTSVDVKIVTAERADVVAVPEQSVFRQEGAWFVFVVKGGRAEKRAVEIGVKNIDWAEIVSGVEVGETIVAETRNDLDDGVRITAL